MVEEIVTAVEPEKTQKTKDNEALTLHLGEEAATYVTDETTRQRLIELLTAKINASGIKKTGTSPVAVTFFFLVVFVAGWFIFFPKPKIQNANS